GGIDHLPDLRRIGEERGNLVPGAPPGRANRGVLLAPHGFEIAQPQLGHVGGLGAIDGPQRRHQLLAILPRHEAQAVAIRWTMGSLKKPAAMSTMPRLSGVATLRISSNPNVL